MEGERNFDLNESYEELRESYPIVERNFDLNESYEESCESDPIGEVFFEPFIGQCFLSMEEAYLFYEKYAKQYGFSIRKSRFDKDKMGEIKRRDYVCHRAGSPPLKIFDPSIEQRNRCSTRCECKAHMRIALKKSFDIFPEEWHVTEFVAVHNHKLLSSEEVRFLPSYRSMTKEDEKEILLLREGGLNVKQIIRVLELQRNVRYGYLSFTPKDVHNLFGRIRGSQSNNDAFHILEQCKLAKDENHNFQYSYTLDGDNRLEHIFWSPSHCFDWYQNFGDVMVFDTTYKINVYNMPFGIFVGIDNHGRTILFGCALLRNETSDAFSWLMRTFVSLMKKAPKSILTDQDPWMSRAIANEMPATKHAFCIWHITSKFSSWFTGILQQQYFAWCSDFYELYRLDNYEEFEERWIGVISKYNLQNNKHVVGLYDIRQFWLPAYLHGHFFGGMSTTGRSESVNAFVKRFTNPHLCLTELMKKVDMAIEDVNQKQLQVKMLDKYRGSSLRTLSPVEKQAQEILTSYSFQKFQGQFGRATNYVIEKYDGFKFRVQYYTGGDSRKHTVNWDGEIASCSCLHFEFWGILCRHILSVFIQEHVFIIPGIYLPTRWRQKVCGEGDSEGMTIETPSESNMNTLETSAPNITTADIQCPPQSKTKGRPPVKRYKSTKEVRVKQVKCCRYCKKSGHYYTTCPEKGDGANTSNPSQKIPRKRSSEVENLNPIFHVKP